MKDIFTIQHTQKLKYINFVKQRSSRFGDYQNFFQNHWKYFNTISCRLATC